jgi:hypothetical protein
MVECEEWSESGGCGAPPHFASTSRRLTGIPECDDYLALYRRCEGHLRPQITAGERRFYAAEEASLVHQAGGPETAALPDACQGMLDQLRKDCPPT